MEYRHKVQYYETDKMGITHHSNYIRWMEEARVEFLSSISWPYTRLEEENIVSPVLSIDIKYNAPTTFSDVVIIDVGVKSLGFSRMSVSYIMKKEDGTLVSQASSDHGFLNREGKPVNIKRDYPLFYEKLSSFLDKSENIVR